MESLDAQVGGWKQGIRQLFSLFLIDGLANACPCGRRIAFKEK
ncbi:hypothetical protein [Kovacikia minuta]|nr:hypothetical protein [Kovacikia minuta]